MNSGAGSALAWRQLAHLTRACEAEGHATAGFRVSGRGLGGGGTTRGAVPQAAAHLVAPRSAAGAGVRVQVKGMVH